MNNSIKDLYDDVIYSASGFNNKYHKIKERYKYVLEINATQNRVGEHASDPIYIFQGKVLTKPNNTQYSKRELEKRFGQWDKFTEIGFPKSALRDLMLCCHNKNINFPTQDKLKFTIEWRKDRKNLRNCEAIITNLSV